MKLKLMDVLPGHFKDIAHSGPPDQSNEFQQTHQNIRIERAGDRHINDIIPGVKMLSSSSVEKPKVINVVPRQVKDNVHSGPDAKLLDQNVEADAQKSFTELTRPDGNGYFYLTNTMPGKERKTLSASLCLPDGRPVKVMYMKDPKGKTCVRITPQKKDNQARSSELINIFSNSSTVKSDKSFVKDHLDNSSLVSPSVIKIPSGKIKILKIGSGSSNTSNIPGYDQSKWRSILPRPPEINVRKEQAPLDKEVFPHILSTSEDERVEALLHKPQEQAAYDIEYKPPPECDENQNATDQTSHICLEENKVSQTSSSGYTENSNLVSI